MALVAPRGAHRPGHLVARPQLAPPDLGGRDVHVIAGLAGRVGAHAYEAAAVGQHVEHSRGGLLLGEGLLLDLWLLLDGIRVLGLGLHRLLGLGLHRLLGIGLLRLLGLGLLALGALRLQDRRDQVCLAEAAVTLDRELRRDRVEIRERALLELLALEDGHAARQATEPGRRTALARAASRRTPGGSASRTRSARCPSW